MEWPSTRMILNRKDCITSTISMAAASAITHSRISWATLFFFLEATFCSTSLICCSTSLLFSLFNCVLPLLPSMSLPFSSHRIRHWTGPILLIGHSINRTRPRKASAPTGPMSSMRLS